MTNYRVPFDTMRADRNSSIAISSFPSSGNLIKLRMLPKANSLRPTARPTKEPNRPKSERSSHNQRPRQPGRKLGVNYSASGLNDLLPADEGKIDQETQKCAADLEERLALITKQEIQNAQKLSKRLRQRCDYFQAACKQKTQKIEETRHEIEILKGSSTLSATHDLEIQKKALTQTLKSLTSEHDSSVAQSEMLSHMYKRTTRDLKTVDKKTIEIQNSLRSVEKRYNEVFAKQLKTQQARDTAIKSAARLEAQLQKGRERQHAELLKIDRVIYESKVQREKIKEHVEKKDTSKHAFSIGGAFAKSQMQSSLVGQRIKAESEKMDSLSMAFAKIQNSTGLSDVNEIVQKFLTRDETYDSLCKSAESARNQIDDLRQEQVDLNNQLNELQSGGNFGNRELYKEVDGHEQKLNDAQRQYRDCRDRNMKLQVLLEECRSSAHKFLTILDPESTFERPTFAKLPDALAMVEQRVTKMLDMVASSLKNPLAKHGTAVPSYKAQQLPQTPSDGTVTTSSSDHAPDKKLVKKAKLSILATPQADELIFQSIMNAKPDVSPRNVRVEKAKARQGDESAVANIMGYDVPVLTDDDWGANSMKTPSSIDSDSESDDDLSRPIQARLTLDRTQLKKQSVKLIERSKRAAEKSPVKEKNPRASK
jgi:hypothetical protein